MVARTGCRSVAHYDVNGPLYRYWRTGGPDDPLDMSVAVSIAEPVAPAGGLKPGSLPVGRCVVACHVGHRDGLLAIDSKIAEWAREQSVELALQRTEHGDV